MAPAAAFLSFLIPVAVRFLIGFLALMTVDLAVALVVMGTLGILPVRRVGLLDFAMVVGG